MESENGVLKALPMTTSRGAAAPHTLPAASGRERHVRDSPVVLGCARTLAAARHLQAWHLACSASGELPQPGPLPRLGAQYLSHIHLPSCGALIFYSFRSQALGAQLVLYVLEKA